jgi:hypothetical protein
MMVRHIRLDRRQFYLFEGLGINSQSALERLESAVDYLAPWSRGRAWRPQVINSRNPARFHDFMLT